MPADPDDAANKYKQTEAQLEAIETEIRETQSLTSEKLPTDALRTLYDKDSNFDKGVSYLAKHYRNVRRVRGDGNCYYRALLYGMCESLLIRPTRTGTHYDKDSKFTRTSRQVWLRTFCIRR